MSSAAVQLIDATKPYQGGNDDLWRLHELDNFDKHRLLAVVGIGTSKIRLHLPTADGSFPWDESFPGEVFPVQDGAVILREETLPEVDVKPEFTFDVAFGEPEVVRGKALVVTLHELVHLVDGIVNQFVRFL